LGTFRSSQIGFPLCCTIYVRTTYECLHRTIAHFSIVPTLFFFFSTYRYLLPTAETPAVLPIGLGISLILNGIFLAHHINNDNALTLPDVLAKRYGKTVEVLVSCCTIASFCCLLAGNLVGMGAIVGYTWGFEQNAAIWLSAAILWAYTVSGGLFSVAVTDVIQGFSGFSGCLVCALYLISTQDPSAPPPSIGFPDYVYPDEDVCAMYGGVPCTYVTGACCYDTAMWCPPNGTFCTTDNGAYPVGDQRIFSDQMTNPTSLSPFPNSIFWYVCDHSSLVSLPIQRHFLTMHVSPIHRYRIGTGAPFLFSESVTLLRSIFRPVAWLPSLPPWQDSVALLPQVLHFWSEFLLPTLAQLLGELYDDACITQSNIFEMFHLCVWAVLLSLVVYSRDSSLAEFTTARTPCTPPLRPIHVPKFWVFPLVQSGTLTPSPLSCF